MAGGTQSGLRVLLLMPLITRGVQAGPHPRDSEVVGLGIAQTPGIFKALKVLMCGYGWEPPLKNLLKVYTSRMVVI